ncbi:hypothetical protein ACI2LF_12295 [Kribbella sp. NPDC020789]
MKLPSPNRLLIQLLQSPFAPLLGRTLVLLRYRTRDHRLIVLPVQALRTDGQLAVLVANADNKHWWRHFRHEEPLEAYIDSAWRPATGLVVHAEPIPPSQHATIASSSTAHVAITLPTPIAPPRGHDLLRLWFWSVTLAEFLGFAVPALTGTATASASPAIAVPALLLAGSIEGALLGFGQASVLRLVLPNLPVRSWIAVTSAAAAFAYLLGLMPSLFANSVAHWPSPLVAAAATCLGLALLASIGTAQWTVLRLHLPHAHSWIYTTAVAWLAGLGIFLAIAMPLWHPGQSALLIAAIAIAAGLLMSATTSAITGLALERLLTKHHRAGEDSSQAMDNAERRVLNDPRGES